MYRAFGTHRFAPVESHLMWVREHRAQNQAVVAAAVAVVHAARTHAVLATNIVLLQLNDGCTCKIATTYFHHLTHGAIT
jgi:hypothetical protein